VRYWWVNQNQTFRQEIDGGYLWSPKRNANGARNPFYEFMREVAPGDLILSLWIPGLLRSAPPHPFATRAPGPPNSVASA
jgi:putative restriction endonuclease